jgi:hypothetical protein
MLGYLLRSGGINLLPKLEARFARERCKSVRARMLLGALTAGIDGKKLAKVRTAD